MQRICDLNKNIYLNIYSTFHSTAAQFFRFCTVFWYLTWPLPFFRNQFLILVACFNNALLRLSTVGQRQIKPNYHFLHYSGYYLLTLKVARWNFLRLFSDDGACRCSHQHLGVEWLSGKHSQSYLCHASVACFGPHIYSVITFRLTNIICYFDDPLGRCRTNAAMLNANAVTNALVTHVIWMAFQQWQSNYVFSDLVLICLEQKTAGLCANCCDMCRSGCGLHKTYQLKPKARNAVFILWKNESTTYCLQRDKDSTTSDYEKHWVMLYYVALCEMSNWGI